MLRNFRTNGVPLITAIGSLFDLNPSGLSPWDLELLSDTNVTEVGSIVKEAYVGPNGSFAENLAAVVELVSDQMFVRSTLKQAEIQSNFTPAYLYQFSFEGFLTSFLPNIEGTGRAGHGEESPYLFATMPLLTDREVLISKQMVKLWANFAKSLKPTPDASDPLFNLTWPQVTPTNIQYLDFDDQIAVKPNRKEKEIAMWNRVYYTYSQQPFNGF
ncbi:cocaine esterase-like isoform X2 [Cylas formicarius]|uniref:cocaine esterase-like isoform X2 n=1 Tax=Cylas formicarius TaxID=197179 RepID=UPI0029584693|nr:cocaine esterase-like isoform X2 [Cylas formicarius]